MIPRSPVPPAKRSPPQVGWQPPRPPSQRPEPQFIPPPRRRRWLDRWGWYEPRLDPMHTTTRQAEALNLALSSPPTSYRGLIVGTDLLSGQLVTHDPFVSYEDKLISSPNAAVIGDVGKGKSSLLKTWACTRQLLLDNRRVVVLDKKLQAGVGEYTALARFLGAPSIRFTVDGRGSRLNLLDPVIALGDDQAVDLEADTGGGLARPTGQMMLLRAVLAEALGRPVSEREGKALRLALVSATQDAHNRARVPVISDIVHHLLHPSDDQARVLDRRVRELQDWGLDPAFALERMIEEDLAGLVDAETSRDVHLDHPSGFTHFDISALPLDGPALRVVMTLINTWQANMLARRSGEGQQTVNVVEEGWHVAEGSVGAIFRRNVKLARGLGLATIAGFHHISDLPPDSPARSLLQEAETVFVYGQGSQDDAEACVELYNLPAGTEETIMALEQGTCLLKVGRRDPILLRHERSQREIALTDTDDALTGISARVAA
ncbi:ATP/GTP-binding protein [Amycolatopsis thailandensis]|uniref:ATP/GTP-binding protein n=2 Tax=Amycolatopsis thailandensis TaxID=589330 RepID=A0A229RC76_9PSEU|nr:ATP/GTP-binding protein [Amycolatopsis thailandensis]